jgi:hypothetical protein
MLAKWSIIYICYGNKCKLCHKKGSTQKNPYFLVIMRKDKSEKDDKIMLMMNGFFGCFL